MQPDLVRVLHMRDATRQALEFIAGRNRADLDADAMLMLAVTRLLEIIGEAAKYVSEPARALAPGVPWREIAGTRDRIAHGYFDINLDIVWDILSLDLPKLERELESLVPRLS